MFNSVLGESVFNKNLRSLGELLDCIKFIYEIRVKFGTGLPAQNLSNFFFDNNFEEIFLYLNRHAPLEVFNFVLLRTANLNLTYLKELTLPRFLKRTSRPKRTPRPVKGFLDLSSFKLFTLFKRLTLTLS